VWRVVLMIRVIRVCTRLHWLAAIGVVLLFASGAFAIVSLFTSLPLVAIMGGLRFWEERTALQRWISDLGSLAVMGWLFWLILAGVFSRPQAGWSAEFGERAPAGASLIVLAIGSVLIWCVVLPFTQPEQQRRYEVETAFRQGRIADAVAVLRAHPREAFPPHWQPPPPMQNQLTLVAPPLDPELEVMEECLGLGVPEWVREVYIRRVLFAVRRGDIPSDDAVQRMARILREVPGGTEALQEAMERWFAHPRPELLLPPKVDR
jgi:hypothetical protein